MDALRPALQRANTDGTGPVKRRRTALSCVECRRRKVKCDRERPCGPCTRTKSATCTFRPNPQARSRPAHSPVPTSRSGSQYGSDLPSPHTNTRTHGSDLIPNRYVSPSSFGVQGKATLEPLPSTNSEVNVVTFTATIKSLMNRVQELEGNLAALSDTTLPGTASLPIRDHPSGPPPAGQFVKSKFYGESHWVNCIEPYEALGTVNQSVTVDPSTDRNTINKSTRLYVAMTECKRMARIIKSARALHPSVSAEIQSSIPTKDVCDQLVQCYLRTFESVFRVLHISSFLKEYEAYWENPAIAKPSAVIKILLVCAIGVPFYNGPVQPRLRSTCTKWVHAAESWLSAPHEKSRLNMTGLQIHILLLLARQICSVDGDLMWISAGALLRSAMHLGLHRDPENFPKISTFHAEMRRRLWATVLEITAQSSLDVGMPPLISLQDFDTRPPANIDDEDISERSTAPLKPKPEGDFTQMSLQIAFNKTLPMRLEVIRMINNLRSDLSYDDALRLGAELMSNFRSNSHRFNTLLAGTSPSLSSRKPNAFQLKLLDVLVRRFVLCLHRPFYAKARTDPRYYYSRKICLDISLAILSPVIATLPGSIPLDDDWTRLMTHGVGFVKSFSLYSLSTVYFEVVSRIEEMQEESMLPASGPQAARLPADFQNLRAILSNTKEMTEARIRAGETNAKAVLFLVCCLARIDALVSGSDAEAAVLEAAEKGVADCAAIMRDANKELGVDVERQLGKEWERAFGRGEGADRVFGDVSGGASGGGEGAGWDMDMDWETLMQDDSLGFGFGFEGSPESWFVGFEGMGD